MARPYSHQCSASCWFTFLLTRLFAQYGQTQPDENGNDRYVTPHRLDLRELTRDYFSLVLSS